jgi:hypothetical protein
MNPTIRHLADRLVTVADLAELLHIEPQTIYNWRSLGIGPPAYRPTGGKLLDRRSDAGEWLRKCIDPPSGSEDRW